MKTSLALAMATAVGLSFGLALGAATQANAFEDRKCSELAAGAKAGGVNGNGCAAANPHDSTARKACMKQADAQAKIANRTGVFEWGGYLGTCRRG